VIVIGAGPAGLSAGIGLIRAGFHVTVLEQTPVVKSRVCGAFLNPEAVRHLEWIGVGEQAQAEGIPVRFCRLTAPFMSESVVPIWQNGREGLGLPRVRLEEILRNKFIEGGGEIETGMKVKSVTINGPAWLIRTVDRNFPADWTVAADGRFSLAHIDTHTMNHDGWYGWNATFSGARQNPGDLSLHFYPGGYVGTLTYRDGQTNVCGLIHRDRTDPIGSWEKIFDEALERQPYLKELLRSSRRESDWRGVGPLPHTMGLRKAEDFALAGDAAAVGDPFMGEGIGRALGSGPMLAHAIALTGGISSFEGEKAKMIYEDLWKKYYTSRLRLGAFTRAVLRRPWLFRPAISFLLKFKAPFVYMHYSHAGWNYEH